MRITIRPVPFIIGFAIGLSLLSLLGALVESRRLSDGFVRFHQGISAEAGYYPTARQVMAIVDSRARPPPKVIVIVGGSSIYYGTGQQRDTVWTRRLQDLLGSDYCVINLAQRGGRGTDFGNLAAERLIGQSRPVIFIADAWMSFYATPLERSPYRYAIADAWSRGYLLPWPPRDAILWGALPDTGSLLHAPLVGALLNRFLSFNELWQYVEYEFVNLAWTPVLADHPFRPRWRIADEGLPPETYKALALEADHQAEVVQTRHDLIGLDAPHWQAARQWTEQLVPPRLRSISIVGLDRINPQVLSDLNAEERALAEANSRKTMVMLRELGFARVLQPTQDFTAEDYVDRVHLSVSGGQKLAIAMAPVVRELASELGYVK